MAKNLVNLNEFEHFNAEEFLAGKTLEAVGAAEVWADFDTGEELGVRTTVEITADKTKYRSKSGRDNVGGRFDVKIPNANIADYAFVGYRVPVQVTKVTDAMRWAARDNGSRNQLTLVGDVEKVKA